ncbi:DUF1848 family protein [Clostridiaceae bacterium]|nr:DUF1848 family protein [Clostridiaceae bacterium]
MAKYRIGATNGGDAGLDLSWRGKMDAVDGAVLITKHITPQFIEAVHNLENVVVHATCTGYGGTVLEPNVPTVTEQFARVKDLIAVGFPKERIVIRVDPIIPTTKGIQTAMGVLKMFMDASFYRYRISIIDMYPHVRKRFAAAGLPLPYGDSFAPHREDWQRVNKMITDTKIYWANGNHSDDIRIEACAEPTLTEAIRCGCVSEYDISLMGLTVDSDDLDTAGYQRRDCLCYSGKKELLNGKKPCPYQCLYCFWKDVK